ncbi:MAG: recombinase family protein [Ethanoligenens sp.]
MKLRILPFGYAVQNGAVVEQPDEAETVRWVFDAYIRGMPYKAIAEQLSHTGPCYHEGKGVWNKNMVKRMLENPQYLGERYPALVSAGCFSAAARVRDTKPCGERASETAQAILKVAVCGVCGAPMRRDTRNTKRGRWYCGGGTCPHATGLHDAELVERVAALLNLATRDPSILEPPEQPSAYASLDITRLSNELSRELEKPDCDEARTTGLILELAAAQYATCPDETPLEKTRELKALFTQASPSDEFDHVLLTAAVDVIRICPDKTVSLRLKNGQVLTEPQKGEHELCPQS